MPRSPAVLILQLVALSHQAWGGEASVVLSNVELPKDTTGANILTGEASVMQHKGTYYFYFNNWGDCPGVDCCEHGCWTCCFSGHDDCTFFFNHTIVAYKSKDLVSFEPMGVVFAPGEFSETNNVTVFRPQVLYNAATDKFVMWYKVKAPKPYEPGHWYGVAAADSPSGPFRVVTSVVPDVHGIVSDAYLFADPESPADAYLIKEGSVTKLNASYTGVDEATEQAELPVPESWEAPIMFTGRVDSATGKRRYFVIGGHNCCACRGGSNAYVFTALGSPLGDWSFVGDIGDNATQCALQTPPVCTRGGHSPLQWIDHAQTSAAFTVQEAGQDEPTTVMLSNQWVTAPPPKRARNQDLLYWNAVRYNASDLPVHITWQNELKLELA